MLDNEYLFDRSIYCLVELFKKVQILLNQSNQRGRDIKLSILLHYDRRKAGGNHHEEIWFLLEGRINMVIYSKNNMYESHMNLITKDKERQN